MHRRTITALLLFCLLSFPSGSDVVANDAPVNLQGGSAQALAGAVAAISMKAEVVRIGLQPKSYVIDATFTFKNTGENLGRCRFPEEGCRASRREVSRNGGLPQL